MNHIVDQNGGSGYDGMRASKTKFAWLNTSPVRNQAPYQSGAWAWLYGRQVAAQKGSEFDPSDAGLIIYLLTGIEKTNPSDAQFIMEHPVNAVNIVVPPVVIVPPAQTLTDINDLVLTKSNCSVGISWSDVGGETGYRVRRKLDSEATYTNIGDLPANATNYVDNTIEAGKTYVYMVRPMVNNLPAKISNTPSISVGNCVLGRLSVQEVVPPMQITLAPNPFVNSMLLDVQNNEGEAKVSLMDDFGNQVHIEVLPAVSSTFQINTFNLKSGVYYVHVTDSKTRIVSRVYKQ